MTATACIRALKFGLQKVSEASRTRGLLQKFRKGVGRQRGLARGNPSCARNSGVFSVPFFLCPLRRRGTHFWRTFWVFFWGFVRRQPPPAKLLFETSDYSGVSPRVGKPPRPHKRPLKRPWRRPRAKKPQRPFQRPNSRPRARRARAPPVACTPIGKFCGKVAHSV